jgi:iron complex outermembrane recepter protein
MRYWVGALGATGLAFALTAPVHAQTTAGGSTQVAEIETVTVTARRRAEDEQRVPINITEVSGEGLRTAEIKTATDLTTIAPTLTVAGNLGSRDDDVFSIRGQGQPFGGADPGVQTYFAEVPFNASGPGTYFDMANIQVLSGPQGTLFGRSTTGGAVLFEPQRPKDEFGGYIDAQAGNYNFGELQGALNVPIVSDTLLVRAAFDIANRNGFTKDTIITGASAPFTINQDNLDYQSFRFGVTWRPFAHFENYAMFDYMHDHTNGTGDVLTGENTSSLAGEVAQINMGPCTNPPTTVICGEFAGFQGALGNALANQQALGVRQTTSSIVPLYRRDTWEGIDIARYDINPNIYLRNIFGYVSDKTQSGFDYDGSYLPILEIPNPRTWETNSLQVTEELQVGGQSDDKGLTWVAGYYHELDHPGGYSEVERDVFGGGNSFPPISTTEIQSLGNGGTSDAVYAHATYDISNWVNGLTLEAGGRYTWDHKVATNLTCAIPPLPSCPYPLTSIYTQPTLSGNFHAPSWTLAANYQVNDDSMVYATYRRGYKSGGFNSGVDPSAGVSEFQPEFLTDVEVGTKDKWTLVGMPGVTDFDAYYGWYDDIQKNDLINVISGSGTIPSALTLNAARANIKGIDFQSTIVPDEHLDVTAFYSYIDATYGSFALPQAIVFGTPVNVQTHVGNPFVYTPANKFGVTAKLHFIVDPAIGIPTFSVTWYNQSRVWFTDLADSEPDGSQGSYNLINLRFDWNNFMGTSADLGIFVNNVTDQVYKVGGNPLENLVGTDSSIYGAPRMFGAEVRYRFGADARE